MDDYIRQLPHDNQQLAARWPDIFNELHKLARDISDEEQPTFGVKVLDALVDYAQADTGEFDSTKGTLITVTLEKLSKEFPAPLEELVRIFCRILNVLRINQVLHVTLLESIYNRCELGKNLSFPPSTGLIQSILSTLQQHSFLNTDCADGKIRDRWKQFFGRRLFSPLDSDRNKINYHETMQQMRSGFQQLFR